MKAFKDLNFDGLLADGCKKLTPFLQFVRLYKETDGKPCSRCEYLNGCKAYETHFKTSGLSNKQIARRDGISLNEVRRRRDAGEYSD